MVMPLGEIATLVGGHLHGDALLPITGAAILRDAHEGDITLVDQRHLGQLTSCRASAVLVPSHLAPPDKPCVAVEDVHASFAKIVEHFRPLTAQRALGVSVDACVHKTARLGPHVVVHAGATIGEDVEIGADTVIHPGVRVLAGCRIGANVTIFPNAVLYENTVVGNRVLIHAGAVIGAYGFGYSMANGRHQRGGQLGYVQLDDDVEVGANTTIDRGTYGPTHIGEGTKIDNLVMIAHNCRIGRHNLICSQVGIAGSCTTGDYVVLAGQVGLRDHIQITDRVVVAAKSGVMNNITEPGTWLGIPVAPEREHLVKLASLSKLPEMRKEFKALQRKVAELSAQLAAPGEGS
ncbi:MAG: UDP-3-O-(3-hydroxymyristoyl)glucosamine N-acyltransferase [Pirellulaceae bacterium]